MKTTKQNLLLASILLAGSSAHALASGNSSHMEITGRTSQPIGHFLYCKQYVDDCNIISQSANVVKLTRTRWKDLVEINNFSNNTVTPVTDFEAYNKEEHWTYPTKFGDCEDFVLMKRHLLMQRGWPASALLITVVLQPNGEGHAVLTVRTDKADYILDNLDGHIKPWNQTPYTYLKRQDVNNSGHWAQIKDYRT